MTIGLAYQEDCLRYAGDIFDIRYVSHLSLDSLFMLRQLVLRYLAYN